MLSGKQIFKVLLFICFFIIGSNYIISRDYFNLYWKTKSKQIYCFIITTAEQLDDQAIVTYETWASKCDNHAFITLLSDEQITKSTLLKKGSNLMRYNNTFNVLHPKHFVTDSYKNLTTKIHLAIADIYKENNDYEWYLKADTDTFIFMNNLKRFLTDKNSSQPVTYGYDMSLPPLNERYHSGGAGYILSNEAFNRLGRNLKENPKLCPNTGIEDVDIAMCLKKLKVYPETSLDEYGRERFHSVDVISHYTGNNTKWLESYATNPLKKGLDCCSHSTISFHYQTNKEMKLFKSIIDNEFAVYFNFSEFYEIFNRSIMKENKNQINDYLI